MIAKRVPWVFLLLVLSSGDGVSVVASSASTARATARMAHVSRPPAPDAAASARELLVVVREVNQQRAAIGCKPLVWDERLARLARKYSESMAREGFFGHVDPDGRDPFDRMRRAGIHFRAAGENLALGQTRGIQVFADWMRSPGHRAVIENCEYTHLGIGLYRNRWSYLSARY